MVDLPIDLDMHLTEHGFRNYIRAVLESPRSARKIREQEGLPLYSIKFELISPEDYGPIIKQIGRGRFTEISNALDSLPEEWIITEKNIMYPIDSSPPQSGFFTRGLRRELTHRLIEDTLDVNIEELFKVEESQTIIPYKRGEITLRSLPVDNLSKNPLPNLLQVTYKKSAVQY